MPATVVLSAEVLACRSIEVECSADVQPHYWAGVGRAKVGGPAAWLAAGVLGADVGPRAVASVGDDPEGLLCRQGLSAAGVDTAYLAVIPDARTGQELECVRYEVDDEEILVTVPGPRPAAPIRAALEGCRAGDALVLHTWSWDDDLVAEAFDRDLQIIADLRPFPRWGRNHSPCEPADLSRVDIAVIDVEGAGLLAESEAVVGSTVVLAGAEGASWDGDLVRPRQRGMPPEVGAAASTKAHHIFTGRLAAELARGADRPEALTAALSAWHSYLNGPGWQW